MLEKLKVLSYLRPFYKGKEIKKELFYNKISNEDKKIFDRYIDKIKLMYSIKPKLNRFNAYRTDKEDYSEIQIIKVSINNNRAIRDIYSTLISIIPYPIFAIFKYKDKQAFVAASNQKINSKDLNRNTKGNIFITHWFETESLVDFTNYIITSEKNLKKFYEHIVFWVSTDREMWVKLYRIMTILDLTFEINDKEYMKNSILLYCDYRYKCPWIRWKSKLDKYKEYDNYEKMIEIHSLWNYLKYYSYISEKFQRFIKEHDNIGNWLELEKYCIYEIENLENEEYKNIEEMEDEMNEFTD